MVDDYKTYQEMRHTADYFDWKAKKLQREALSHARQAERDIKYLETRPKWKDHYENFTAMYPDSTIERQIEIAKEYSDKATYYSNLADELNKIANDMQY